MTNKKGQTMTLIYILLALATLTLLISLTGTALRGCEKTFDIRKCHDTLLGESILYKKISEVSVVTSLADVNRPWPVTCKTVGPLTIEGKTDSEIMRNIAENMRNCWWALGQGGKEFDPFKMKFGQMECYNCFTFKVNKVNNVDKIIKKDDFNQWLKLNYLDYDTAKPTYWNYMTPADASIKPDQTVLSGLNMVLDDIIPGTYYAITYRDSVSSLFIERSDADAIFLVDLNKASQCGDFTESEDTKDETAKS
ncbi:MAG: hypothetical protein NT001_00125 [Candidatus Woesearchaeota archaeon]|nr:hypothetical protein [Candidatus Woesearchaeota archaeon]